MANGAPLTRYHAEIKLTVEGKEARINIFADTLNEIFSDMAKITIQYDRLHSQAIRELDNAALKADQLRKDGKLPPNKDPKSQQPDQRPICASCGSRDNMELIRWADKKTQEARSAWKCQACDQWHFPNGK